MSRPTTYIEFDGDKLMGTPRPYRRPTPEPKIINRSWPGGRGESSIRLGQSGATLELRFVLHDQHATRADVRKLINKWQEKIGYKNDTLKIQGADLEEYKLAELVAFVPGQTLPSVMVGQGGIEGFFCEVQMVFRLLGVGVVDDF